MNLTLREIRAALRGSVSTEEKEGRFVFHRFAENQKEKLTSAHRRRAESLAGMRLDFVTDSPWISFSLKNAWLSCRRGFYFFDLLIDGKLMAHEGVDLGQNDDPTPPLRPLPDADYSFEIGGGKKRVTLCLPQIAYSELASFSLKDGAFFEPAAPRRTIVSFGDSITEGMDARYPSLHYLHRTASEFDAALHNFSIAGGQFDPTVITEDLPRADLVTTAYGTNDFRHSSAERFGRDMPLFFEKLNRSYPETPVFVLLPFYRKCIQADRYEIGTMDDVRDAIRAEAKKYANFQVLESKYFVPPIPTFFGDGRLHPNELGNLSIASHLIAEIRSRLAW